MNHKNRQFFDILEARLCEKEPLIQVLIGPRQVGKSTAIRNLLAGRGVYHSADSPTPQSHEILQEVWKKSLEFANEEERILAVDEIQKITGWRETIKHLWDTSPLRPKVILSGSSAVLVEKGITETLAGRFELIRAEHWNLQEATDIFGTTWMAFLEFGCYPGSVGFLNDVERWGAYIRDSIVESALGRDLLMLHPVEQPALLRQLFSVAVNLPAQIVSLQKLQGQLQGMGSLPTLQNYLRLFEMAFLVTGLEKYSTTALRLKRSSPKLIVHDNALIRAFERPILASPDAARMGRYFENAVAARFLESGWDTYYWNQGDHEVDLVTLGPQGEKLAIEVKLGPVNRSELRSLFKFCKIHPEFKACLISGVDQSDIEGIVTLDRNSVLCLSRGAKLVEIH
jgi:predicted AAA+ superfamily ATPase